MNDAVKLVSSSNINAMLEENNCHKDRKGFSQKTYPKL